MATAKSRRASSRALFATVSLFEKMFEKTRYLVKVLAIISIIYGGIKLPSGIKSVWLIIQHFFYSTTNSLWVILYLSSLTFFFSLVFPIGAICAGLGLLQQKKWGWILSIILSLVIFTINCAGTINFAIASYYFRNIPIPPIPEGAHVGYYSMIPTYITTFISLAFIIVLRHKSVKNIFFQMN